MNRSLPIIDSRTDPSELERLLITAPFPDQDPNTQSRLLYPRPPFQGAGLEKLLYASTMPDQKHGLPETAYTATDRQNPYYSAPGPRGIEIPIWARMIWFAILAVGPGFLYGVAAGYIPIVAAVLFILVGVCAALIGLTLSAWVYEE